jgi:hypothetical protein
MTWPWPCACCLLSKRMLCLPFPGLACPHNSIRPGVSTLLRHAGASAAVSQGASRLNPAHAAAWRQHAPPRNTQCAMLSLCSGLVCGRLSRRLPVGVQLAWAAAAPSPRASSSALPTIKSPCLRHALHLSSFVVLAVQFAALFIAFRLPPRSSLRALLDCS